MKKIILVLGILLVAGSGKGDVGHASNAESNQAVFEFFRQHPKPVPDAISAFEKALKEGKNPEITKRLQIIYDSGRVEVENSLSAVPLSIGCTAQVCEYSYLVTKEYSTPESREYVPKGPGDRQISLIAAVVTVRNNQAEPTIDKVLSEQDIASILPKK